MNEQINKNKIWFFHCCTNETFDTRWPGSLFSDYWNCGNHQNYQWDLTFLSKICHAKRNPTLQFEAFESSGKQQKNGMKNQLIFQINVEWWWSWWKPRKAKERSITNSCQPCINFERLLTGWEWKQKIGQYLTASEHLWLVLFLPSEVT